MILPDLNLFQLISIAVVGQGGLFATSNRRQLHAYQDDEVIEYHVILCSEWDDEDYPCQAGIYARDLQDGTGQVVVTNTNYIHNDICVARQLRRQQQQEVNLNEHPETISEPSREERASAPQEVPLAAVCVTNTTTAAFPSSQSSPKVQEPVLSSTSSPTILKKEQLRQTEAAGPSSCGPVQSDALIKAGTVYKTLKEANAAIKAWHAQAYPYRSPKHGMKKHKNIRLSVDINCKLGHEQKVKGCGARIRLIRCNETNALHVGEVYLQHSVVCDAYVSARASRTTFPRDEAVAQVTKVPPSTSTLSMPVEGLTDRVPRENPLELTSITLDDIHPLQQTSVVGNAGETVDIGPVVHRSSVNEIKMLDPGAKASSLDMRPLIDNSLASRAQSSSMLPNSQELSVLPISTIPERRPRQMARRGGRPAHSSRLQHQRRETSTDSREYAGNTPSIGICNSSEVVAKKTESPALPLESTPSDTGGKAATSTHSGSKHAFDRLIDLGITPELCDRFSMHGINTIAQFQQLGVRKRDFKSICKFVRKQNPDRVGDTQGVETYLLRHRIYHASK